MKNTYLKNENIKTLEDYICNNLKLNNISLLDKKTNYLIKDIDKFVEIIKFHKDKKIKVVGDYDVDGVTSCRELDEILAFFNANYSFRFPKRISEGYGLSSHIIDEILADDEVSLVILADNGIVSVEAVERMNEKGIDTIIIDHHLRRDDGLIPNAKLIINPHVIENQSECIEYCTAGLVLKIAENIPNFPKERLLRIKSFAAIGTVADAVPMIEDNRLIVKEGLKTMLTKEGRTLGLYALLNKLWLLYHCTEDNIGYKIGPCINAVGRLLDDGAKIVFDILKDDYNTVDEAMERVEILLQYNKERKQIVDIKTPTLFEQIKEKGKENFLPIVEYLPDIPEGIIGILAGKVAEKYKTAAFVFTNVEEDDGTVKYYKGSGRSYNNIIHLKNTLDICKNTMVKYGGHEGAAGLTIEADKILDFENTMINASGTKHISNDKNEYDFKINADEVSIWNDKVENYAPWGTNNPAPIFLITGFKINSFEYMGEDKKTVKIIYNNDNTRIEALSFERTVALDNFLSSHIGETVSFLGTLTKNYTKNGVIHQILISEYGEDEVIQKTSRNSYLDNLLDSLF